MNRAERRQGQRDGWVCEHGHPKKTDGTGEPVCPHWCGFERPLSPNNFEDQEAYAIATAQAAIADPDQEYLCGENGGHVEIEYAVEPDRGGPARAHDSELAGPIEELVCYRDGARLVTRQITYGAWRYVTPEEIANG